MISSGSVRVAQVVRPAQGGIRRHVSLLCAHLDQRLYRSAVYAPAEFTLERAVPGVLTHEIAIGARTSPAADLKAIVRLTKMLRGQADIVHAHGLRAALVGVLAGARAGVPTVFTAHNMPPKLTALQRVMLLLVCNRASAIVSVSQAVSSALVAAGVEPERCHVIPNGIEIDDYLCAEASLPSVIGASPTDQVVVYLGRLSPEKGVDTLISAFALLKLRRASLFLAIAGDGPQREELILSAAGMSDLHFLGNISDPAALLKSASVVAVPSYTEGQGIVAIEAMACGKAVVCSNVGGLRETVIDGETGILVTPGNPEMLADAIDRMLNDNELRTKMGLNGIQRVSAEFTIDRMIAKIQDVYRTLRADT